MTDDNQNDHDRELPDNAFLTDRHNAVRQIIHDYGDMFDSLQILATVQQPNGPRTYKFSKGCGDWYARKGMAIDLIHQDQSKAIAVAVADELRNLP